VAGSAAAAAAAGGGAAASGAGAGKVGKGKDDGKIWGNYPHTTHWSWVTAIYLMVMAFLKEICFTIFSVPFMKVDLGKQSNYVGLAWIVLLCCSVVYGGLIYVAALCVCAVLLAGYDVWVNRATNERLAHMRVKLLDP
jgi:hypothetical protein